MRPHRQGGLSLVELLVGCTVALLVVMAASAVVAAQLRESSRLQGDLRLDHELRSAFTLVTRDLRRAGYWSEAASGVAETGRAVVVAPYGPVGAVSAAAEVRFNYAHDGGTDGVVHDAEQFGFRLRSGSLQMQLGSGNWQSLTDPAAIVVTAFTVTPRFEETLLATYCELPCPATAADCPPRQQVRRYDVVLSARSAFDGRQQRSLRSSVRLRNDAVLGSCTA